MKKQIEALENGNSSEETIRVPLSEIPVYMLLWSGIRAAQKLLTDKVNEMGLDPTKFKICECKPVPEYKMEHMEITLITDF